MASAPSIKRLAINKDNSTIFIVVGVAAFLIVFSLIASYALIKQSAYQGRVIGKKKDALKQLETNTQEVETLKKSYQTFADQEKNVLGGSSKGSGERDGENPRLVLDALPSKYDFPALASSLEKLFKPYSIDSITGTDDEIAQGSAQSSTDPQSVEIPFSVAMKGSSQQTKEVLSIFERSIRPFQIQKVTLTGDASQISVNVNAKTYFQPQKKFDVQTEKVK